MHHVFVFFPVTIPASAYRDWVKPRKTFHSRQSGSVCNPTCHGFSNIDNQMPDGPFRGKAKAVPLHAMKAFGGEDAYLLLIFDLGTRRGCVFRVMPRPRFAPGERTAGTHCTGCWVGPRAGLDKKVTGKILSPLPGIEPPSTGRPAPQYWATRLSYGEKG
jgi:hypothetical protein